MQAAPPEPAWPRCGASAAIFRRDRVLLIQRGKGALQGLWSLPGGHVEAGEATRAAAVREVREETGVEAAIRCLVDVHDVLRRDSGGRLTAHYIVAVFCGRWLAGEPVAASDATAAAFVALDEMKGLSMTDGAPAIVRRAWTLLQAPAPCPHADGA